MKPRKSGFAFFWDPHKPIEQVIEEARTDGSLQSGCSVFTFGPVRQNEDREPEGVEFG